MPLFQNLSTKEVLVSRMQKTSKKLTLTTVFFLIFGLVSIILYTNSLPATAIQTVTQTETCSVSLQTTNWTNSCQVDRFDPSLGDLQEITFTMNSNISSIIRVENTDTSAATVTSEVAATVTLRRPDNTSILSSTPQMSVTDNFQAFDGSVDYGGVSGNIHPQVTNSISETFSSTTLNDLTLFTGINQIALPVIAAGNSNFSGTANLATLVDTQAASQISIVYSYLIQDLGVEIYHNDTFSKDTNWEYIIEVTNNDPQATVGQITVVNTIPDGFVFISNDNPDWTCTAALQVLTCTTNKVIPPGGSENLLITVWVDSSTPDQVNNIATVSSPFLDINLIDNDDIDTMDITLTSNITNANSTNQAPLADTGSELPLVALISTGVISLGGILFMVFRSKFSLKK